MEITNKKSVYQHIYLISNFMKNNQDIIISTYILTAIIMKIKQDIINIYIFISYIMKINQDITSTDIFFIILHENKLKILQAQIFFLSYFIKITKNNQYTQSHCKLLKIQLSQILDNNIGFRNHRNYDNSKFINKYY